MPKIKLETTIAPVGTQSRSAYTSREELATEIKNDWSGLDKTYPQSRFRTRSWPPTDSRRETKDTEEREWERKQEEWRLLRTKRFRTRRRPSGDQ